MTRSARLARLNIEAGEAHMSQPFVGQVIAVGFNFAPVGWAFCDGPLLPISQYTALFQLIGTTVRRRRPDDIRPAGPSRAGGARHGPGVRAAALRSGPGRRRRVGHAHRAASSPAIRMRSRRRRPRRRRRRARGSFSARPRRRRRSTRPPERPRRWRAARSRPPRAAASPTRTGSRARRSITSSASFGIFPSQN